MNGRLANCVAIVTGGAQGIGRVYALRLAAEGATMLVADVTDTCSVAQEIVNGGGESLGLRVDVSEPASVEEMIATVLSRFGRADILVNNAALFGALTQQRFEEISVEEWDKVMAVNVKGVFLCFRAVLPSMREQKQGRIINISSTTALRGTPFYVHYVTSKGAVLAFTRALAREVGKFGITVNTIAPGHTLSDSVRGKGPDADKRSVVRRSIQRSQMPEDLVGTVVFLASVDSEFVTGQLIVVDGGDVFH